MKGDFPRDMKASELNGNYDKHQDKEANRRALKWIFEVSKPQLPTIIAIILGEALWAVFGTATALFSREIINSAVDKDESRMFTFIAIYLAVALSLIGVHAVMRYVTERCKAKLEILFRSRMFESMIKRRYSALKDHHTGDLVNRLTGDVAVISDAATTIIPNVVMMSVRLICAMAVLIAFDWRFALVFAIGGIIIFTMSRLIKSKVQYYHRVMQQADGRTRSFWQEIFEHLIVVKAFANEKKSSEKSKELMAEHFNLRMKRSMIGTISMFGTAFIVRLGNIFAIGYGAFCLFSGTMDYGTLTALTQLVGQVQQPFANMSGIMPRYYSALSSATRLIEIEELEPDTVNGDPVDAHNVYRHMKSIDVKNVDFSYDEENPVLKNCSCTINRGDFVSITGMSGIGKSTLFKILLDIYPISSGSAEILTDTENIPVSGRTRTLFAYVPQGNMLFSGSIRENLLFMTDEKNVSDEAIRKAIECACANRFIDELPDGIDSVIGENGVGLSEGQIQRISVARAILSEAPILLLDEATSALDEANEAELLANLKKMTDRTCIIVTHKKAALAICNRHFAIKDKNILEI